MRIIIAPAKQMKEDTNTLPYAELPVFLDKAERLKNYVNSLSYDEQKRLWACSDKIAQENHVRFAETDLRKRLTPAILAYDGIQYTYMAPDVFEQQYFDYVQEHVRILSERQRLTAAKTCTNSGVTVCTARCCPRTESLSTSLQRNTPSASKNICSRRTDSSPSFSASCKTARSCRREFTQKWQGVKWCALPLKSTRNHPKN